MSDKDLRDEILAARVKRIERMLQLWFRWNSGNLPDEGKPRVDGYTVQLSKEERKELGDLIYGNVVDTKKAW